MKTITIYPTIRMEIEVPDDYDGILENDMNLVADFSETTFDVEGIQLGECYLDGWQDEDMMA